MTPTPSRPRTPAELRASVARANRARAAAGSGPANPASVTASKGDGIDRRAIWSRAMKAGAKSGPHIADE